VELAERLTGGQKPIACLGSPERKSSAVDKFCSLGSPPSAPAPWLLAAWLRFRGPVVDNGEIHLPLEHVDPSDVNAQLVADREAATGLGIKSEHHLRKEFAVLPPTAIKNEAV
jgi:hypothetical protein